jgi:hypothetical protein
VAEFEIVSQHLPGGNDENHEKPFVRIAGLLADTIFIILITTLSLLLGNCTLAPLTGLVQI